MPRNAFSGNPFKALRHAISKLNEVHGIGIKLSQETWLPPNADCSRTMKMLSDNSYCSINRVLLCATGFASVCCKWGEHWQSQWHAIDQ